MTPILLKGKVSLSRETSELLALLFAHLKVDLEAWGFDKRYYSIMLMAGHHHIVQILSAGMVRC